MKLRGVVDVRALLEEQIEAVRADIDVDTIERARAIGYLLTIGLRSIEGVDLAARMAKLEEAMAQPRIGNDPSGFHRPTASGSSQ